MKLLGEYLREVTSLSHEQLVEQLRLQCEMGDQGKQVRLGQLLVNAGYVSDEDLREALDRQDAERTDVPIGTPQYYWIPRSSLWDSQGSISDWS